jgi:hypothetical protein
MVREMWVCTSWLQVVTILPEDGSASKSLPVVSYLESGHLPLICTFFEGKIIGKSKFVPVLKTPRRRTEKWRYSSIILTSALDWCECSVLHPGEETPVSIGYEAGWAPEPVWTLWSKNNFSPLSGIRHRPCSSLLYRLQYWGSKNRYEIITPENKIIY